MRIRRTLALLTAAALLGAAARDAAAIVIDDFTVGSIVVNGPAQLDQTDVDPAHVIGGTRRFLVGEYGNGSRLEIADGLQFGSTGWGYFRLTYGGVAPLGGIDLTQGGHDRILFRFGEIGPGFHPFGLYVNKPSNSSSNGQSLYLLDAWDDIVLEARYSTFPTTFTAVDTIIVDAFRNPANSEFEIKSIVTGRRELPGDFNYDGVVDLADLAAWQRTLGVNTRNGLLVGFVASADADENGLVDGADFLIWQRNLGATAPNPIPEPAAATLSASALVGLALRAMYTARRGHGGGRRSEEQQPPASAGG